MMQSPLVILPCAGFGRRVGAPNSKELLPLRQGRPLIEEPLDLAHQLGWWALVLTRPEKTTLVKYLQVEAKSGVDTLIVPETREWPETMLLSQAKWADWNLLVLPDTDYDPKDIWLRMFRLIDSQTSLVVANHQVLDRSTWGAHDIGASIDAGSQGSVRLSEKALAGPGSAWGLILFRKDIGAALFEGFIASRESGQPVSCPEIKKSAVKATALSGFRDLTR